MFYDVWEKKLLDGGASGLTMGLVPMSCKLIAVRPAADHPQLVGTSRHITQGADDLLEATWDPATATWSGRSRVVGGDPYELRFTLPPGWAVAGGSAKIEGPLAVLTLSSDENKELPWRIAFRRGTAAEPKAALQAAKVVLHDFGAVVSWQDDGAVAHRVYRDGQLLGQTAGTSFADHVRRRGVTYRYEVAAVTWAGEGPRIDAGQVTRPPLPRRQAKDAWLDDLRPTFQQQDCGTLGLRQTFDNNPLRIAGRKYDRGLGTHANSEIRYRLDNGYAPLEAEVGVDDEKDGAGTVVFQVFTDGCKVFDSGTMHGKQPAQEITIPLDGVEEMTLIVTDAGDGITCDHADWGSCPGHREPLIGTMKKAGQAVGPPGLWLGPTCPMPTSKRCWSFRRSSCPSMHGAYGPFGCFRGSGFAKEVAADAPSDSPAPAPIGQIFRHKLLRSTATHRSQFCPGPNATQPPAQPADVLACSTSRC